MMMGRAFNLASLLNGSGLVSLTSKVTGSLPNTNIEAMAASKLTGQVPDANAPSGSVIQVVQAVRSTLLTFNTVHPNYTQYVSGSITTTIENSRILVLANVPCYHSSGGSWASSGYHRMKENGTIVSGYEHPGVLSVSEIAQMLQFEFLTSPKAVGTYTYTLEGAITDSSGTMHIARNAGSQSSVRLTMMELAP